MSTIAVNDLTFSYEDSSENIFKNLSLNIDSNWNLGLVGRNGRGKTTFLRLLKGDLGLKNEVEAIVGFSYFPLKISDTNGISLYELQKQLFFEQWQLEKELRLLKTNPDILWQPFNSLSGGEQTKLLLAASFIQENGFALIDEPTNHLDEKSRNIVADYLNKHQGYILVSHDRDFLNKTTDHILAIENKEIHLYKGNFASYEETKRNKDEFNIQKNKKLKSEINRLNQSKAKTANFASQAEAGKKANHHANEINAYIDKGFISHRAAKVMQKSKNLERRRDKNIQEKKDLLVNIENIDKLEINFIPNYHSNLLTVENLALQIDRKKLFSNLSFKLKNQGIITLEGDNGIGKSTLFKLLLGQSNAKVESGNYELTNNLKISYLPQLFDQYTGTLVDFCNKEKISYTALLRNLKKMGFDRKDFHTSIENMSLGQQKRVALAKSLIEPANLYLWDEPANYLDVFNQDQLISLLKKVKPAMILIEHDQNFINEVSDSVYHIK